MILIRNKDNYGYADGNNVGIKFALSVLNSQYVLLLNNDTIVDPNFLSEMVKVVESNEMIGFTGPKTYYYDFNGRNDVINFAGDKFDMWKGQPYHIDANEIDEGQHDQTREVNYVEGSCLLAKQKVLDQIGLLNSNYFAYWEDNDLCVRGFKAGYKSVYAPKAKVWHKVSSSSDSTTKIYYLTKNKFLG